MDDLRRRSEATSITKIRDHETEETEPVEDDENAFHIDPILERRVRLKVDLRLCSIAAILASLNLLDSGIISSASVTSMRDDLGLSGNRYSVSIFIFTLASIAFQLPATIAVRTYGPRRFFPVITIGFGVVTIGTAFITTWRQMIVMRVLLGMCMSGIYPGLTYLIATWYPRNEQQTRYAFLQTGQCIILATGSIVNWALNHLGGKGGLKGWQYMFLVQGLVTVTIGFLSYFWVVDFPEEAHKSMWFLSDEEQRLAVLRIRRDRDDVIAEPFSWGKVLVHAKDAKIYGFAVMFFLVNIVATSLSYFLPIILSGMGFGQDAAIILSAPPYYYSVIPVVSNYCLSVEETYANLLLLSAHLVRHLRSIWHTWSCHHLQLLVSYNRILHDWICQQSGCSIYRHFSGYGSLCLELCSRYSLLADKRGNTLEESVHGCLNHSHERGGRHCWVLYRARNRSPTLYHGGGRFDRVACSHDRLRADAFDVVLGRKSTTESRCHLREYSRISIHVLSDGLAEYDHHQPLTST